MLAGHLSQPSLIRAELFALILADPRTRRVRGV